MVTVEPHLKRWLSGGEEGSGDCRGVDTDDCDVDIGSQESGAHPQQAVSDWLNWGDSRERMAHGEAVDIDSW